MGQSTLKKITTETLPVSQSFFFLNELLNQNGLHWEGGVRGRGKKWSVYAI